jgi:hypothetical protein
MVLPVQIVPDPPPPITPENGQVVHPGGVVDRGRSRP